jgi:hypothetical protein
MTKVTGTLHGDQYIFIILSRSISLRMRNVSVKFAEKMKINILCPKSFLKYRVVYKIM